VAVAAPGRPPPRRTRYGRAVAVGILAGVLAFGGLGIWTAMNLPAPGGEAPARADSAAAAGSAVLEEEGPAPAEPRGEERAAPAPARSGGTRTPGGARAGAAAPAPLRAGAARRVPARALEDVLRQAVELFEGSGAGEGPAPGGLARMVREIRKLVRESPGLPEARAARGVAAALLEGRFDAAVRDLEGAVRLRPEGKEIRILRAQVLAASGRFDEALAELREAARLSPDDAALAVARGGVLFRAGRLAEARRVLEGVLRARPGRASARILLARVQIRAGDGAAAVRTLAPLVRRGQADVGARFWTAYARSGERVGRPPRNLLATLNPGRERSPDLAYLMAILYTRLGQPDRAVQSLERAARGRAPSLVWARVDPELAPLRKDPRFEQALARPRPPR